MQAQELGKPCGFCGGERLKYKHCVPCAKVKRKAFYQANKERWVGYRAKRYSEHREEFNAYKRRWRAENPGRTAEQWARDLQNLLDKDPGYFVKWRKNNPENCRARTRKYRAKKMSAFGSFTESEWLKIVESQNGKCKHCGERRPLERDHIVPISLGGSDMAVNIQGLCRTCNASKSNKLDYGVQLSVFDRVAF